jgi:aminopeptidase
LQIAPLQENPVPDPREKKLAEIIVRHSCRVQKDEKVLIETFDIPSEFTALLVREVAAAGGLPICFTKQNRVLRELYLHATEDQMKFWGDAERKVMEGVQCYVGLRGSLNATEFADVPQDRMDTYLAHMWHPVHTKVRVPRTKWVVLRWPTPSMAQQAQVSTEAFEDFYFDVCTVDYEAMARDMQPLQARMAKANDVHIVGPGTDLRFSIGEIPVVGCAGERNIPDGEMFTSPVRDSVHGSLSVNTKSLYQGIVFEDIQLTFEAGRITEATANHTERFNQILDTDEGARFIGEFSIAFNPRILQPMMDTLFDEKIAGSFHFTPGQAYEEADNSNRSQIHWDMVTIQRPDCGGGEIYFDGELIREDGLFVTEDLADLNYET